MQSKHIFVGGQGVVVTVELTDDQKKWCVMDSEAASHVSLAIHTDH